MAEAFTWFSKLTDVLEQVPDEGMRQRLAYAVVMYGSMDVEPELEWPLNALFEAVREDIDNSRAARVRGRKGGRPRKAKKNEAATDDAGDAWEDPSGHRTTDDPGFDAQEAASTDPEMVPEATGFQDSEISLQAGFQNSETIGFQTQKPLLQTGFANSKTSGFAIGETQTKPNQAKPSQTKPTQTKGEGRAGAPTARKKRAQRPLVANDPPTAEQITAYGRESGYSINPHAFLNHYEGTGWRKTNGQPVRDWQAAVRSWWFNDHPDSEPPKPQGAAPKKRSAADELADVNAKLAAMEGGA